MTQRLADYAKLLFAEFMLYGAAVDLYLAEQAGDSVYIAAAKQIRAQWQCYRDDMLLQQHIRRLI